MSVETSSYYDSLLTAQNTQAAIEYTTDDEQTQLTSEDFLTLLVTELQYQDPTDPMDNTEMVNQITQYSQLDELTSMNEKMDAMTEALNAMTGSNGLDYLGKEVEAEGYIITKSGDDVTPLSYALGDYAESVTFNIYDGDGNIVDTVIETGVEAGTHSFQWDGTDSDGNSMEDNNYIIVATATNSDGSTVDVPTATSGTVTGVTNTTNGTYLTLDDGRTVHMADVYTVSTPSDSSEQTNTSDETNTSEQTETSEETETTGEAS